MAGTLRGVLPVARRQRAVVLTYHTVGPQWYAIDPEQFALQMRYLSEHATVVDLDTLVGQTWRQGAASLVCAITFDDGFAGVYEQAFPILQQYGFPATFYVTTGPIDERVPRNSSDHPPLYPGERMVTWQQLREMERHGTSIGSHGVRHLDMLRLSPSRARTDLVRSKRDIEGKLGNPVRHYSYPYGRFVRDTVELVREAGYQTAVTVKHSGIPRKLDPMRIPRLNIAQQYSLDDFEAIVNGDWDYLRVVRLIKQPRIRSEYGLPPEVWESD